MFTKRNNWRVIVALALGLYSAIFIGASIYEYNHQYNLEDG